MEIEPPESRPVPDCSTLPGLLRRIATPLHPRLMAYLFSLLFCCLLGAYEVRRVDTYNEEVRPYAEDSQILSFRRTFIPDPDGTRWVVYAQKAIDEGSWRLPHWSAEDNYPDGRFVGWSSPPMWWLQGMGYAHHLLSGQDMKTAIAEVAPHYNTLIWVFAAATMGWMFIAAFGWRGALVIPALYSTLIISKYGIFSPDHHLWILLSALGTLTCVTAPFYRKRTAVAEWAWFIGAAAFCALGFWISAPSQAIVVIGIGVGMLCIPTESAKKVDSAYWRYFGECTALLSLAAYWLEFGFLFPMHVELNSPVYAAAALVAGLWLWQLHDFAASGRRWDALCPRVIVYSALGFGIILLPLIVYLPYCFSLADPYFSRWEAQIAEEQPIDLLGFMTANGFLFAATIAAVAGLIVRVRKEGAALISFFALVGGMMLVYGYFGLEHNRFSETVIGCCCILIALGLPVRRADVAGWFVVTFSAFLCLGAMCRSAAARNSAKLYGLPGQLSSCQDARVLSENLLKAWTGDSGGVLVPSNEASLVNYFTGLPVYGSAYWENRDGLLFAYRLLFDERPEGQTAWTDVRRMIRHGKVRMIAIPMDFGYQSSYMLYGKDRITDARFTFAYHLIHAKPEELEPWLKLEKEDDHYRVFSVIADAPDVAPPDEAVPDDDKVVPSAVED